MSVFNGLIHTQGRLKIAATFVAVGRLLQVADFSISVTDSSWTRGEEAIIIKSSCKNKKGSVV